MIIGNLPKDRGVQLDLNKWYFSLEIKKCPPNMIGIIRPHVFICLMKILDYGEPQIMNGREMKKKGFYRRFNSPYGFNFEFHKYK